MKNEENDSDYNDDKPPQTSVYEILGLLKFLNPNDDLRASVMMAIYMVKNGYNVDIEEVIKKKYGTKKSIHCGIGWKGENTDVVIIFLEKDESWYDKGCKVYIQYVN